MLTQVLRQIQASKGTLKLSELSGRLGVEESALVGMLDFWKRKGKLRLEGAIDDISAECAGTCSTTCPGPAACPLFVKLPKMYELTIRIDD